VYAYGCQADKFSGIYENTDIFHKMMDAFGFINK
jgi:alkaline phosphatase